MSSAQPAGCRVVVALDVDAFYAQCAELQDSSLRSRPVGVRQKAIVVTANYKARAMGVFKLQLVSEAKKACPELVLVPGEDLTSFRAVSLAVFELLCCSFTPLAQRLGMDEVFLDVTRAVDSLEASARRAPSCSRQAWPGYVRAPSAWASEVVERLCPLAELAHGWDSGADALGAVEAAAASARAVGDAGTSNDVDGLKESRAVEPAWAPFRDRRTGAVREEEAVLSLPDPEPSEAVPCPDPTAQWAPTPVSLLPSGAAASSSRADLRLRLGCCLAARIRWPHGPPPHPPAAAAACPAKRPQSRPRSTAGAQRAAPPHPATREVRPRRPVPPPRRWSRGRTRRWSHRHRPPPPPRRPP